MSEERHDRLEQIFTAALALAHRERGGYVARACGGDKALESELDELLRAHEGADEVVPLSSGRSCQADADDPSVGGGRRIGEYRLRRRIAVGGMGVVYEAEQEHPHRTVALKVLRRGVVSRSALRRFQHESEILGHLKHANIAQIFNAGTLDDGEGAQPYFAMEYIAGQSLTRYAESMQLSTPDRLGVFVEICDAVQYAHQRGVIHRDLKPDNILIEKRLEDGIGVGANARGSLGHPKILDFGVARATDADIHATTRDTHIGQLIGTIPYMSPEQAAGNPNELDTRSDVYSLGVVLHELLTGRLPHDLVDLDIPEAIRVVREDEPVRLSSIDRTWRGDLDTIVAKALEKDRERRYQSARDLAADVRRYLRNEPVLATPPSLVYKLGKFVRRNRLAVASTASVMLALVVGLSVAVVEARRAAREAESAHAINRFFTDMLASVDVWQLHQLSGVGRDEPLTPARARGFGRNVPVVEMVRQATDRIDASFAGKPELQADVHETVGMLFLGLWSYPDAREQFEAALDRRLVVCDENHPDVLRAKLQLAYAIRESGAGEYTRTEELAREAYDGMWPQWDKDDARALTAARVLASALADQRRSDEADALFVETLERQLVLGAHHRDRLMTMKCRFDALFYQGRERECEQVASEMSDLVAAGEYDEDDIITIMSELQMAGVLFFRDEFDAATPHANRAYANASRSLGADHPFTYKAMQLQAQSLPRSEPARRIEVFEASLEGFRAALGDGHLHTLATSLALATVFVEHGDFDRAIELLEWLVTQLRMVDGVNRYGLGGSDGLLMLSTRKWLARARARAGDLEEARVEATKALETARVVAERPNAIPFDLHFHAELLLTIEPVDLRDPELALRQALRAVALCDDDMRGERHFGRTAYVLDVLALAQERTGDRDAAARTRIERLGYLLEDEAEAWQFESLAWRLAARSGLSGDAYEAALEAAERAVEKRRAGWTLDTLGAAQYRNGRPEQALATLIDARERRGSESPAGAAFTAMAHHRLGHTDDAEAALTRLRELMRIADADSDGQALQREAQTLLAGR